MYKVDVPDIRAKELLTIVTLAAYGSFVAAAAHLKTSQPALTRTVKRVERILGVTLFLRNTRRVEITTAGREFVAVAERVLDELQTTLRRFGERPQEQPGRVTVSTYSAFAMHPLPVLVKNYRDTQPLIEVNIREGRQVDIVEDVRSTAADFGIGYIDQLPDLMEATLLRKESIYALLPAMHPLAANRPPEITLGALRDEVLVSGPGEGSVRRLTDGAAATLGFAWRYSVTVDRQLSIIPHVRAGAGIGLLPEGCLLTPAGPDGIHIARIIEPSLSVSVGLITLRRRYLPPAAVALVALIRASADARRLDQPTAPAPVVTQPA